MDQLSAPFSVLPPDDAPAYAATVFIDTENAFFWADADPERPRTRAAYPHRKRRDRLDQMYASAFGLSASQDETLSEDELMQLGGAVFDALDEWATRWLGLGRHDLRSYGKGSDPATYALRDRVDAGHYVHVKVSRDDDAADIALAKDLEDRARRTPPQHFLVVSSDKAKVLSWSNRIAETAQQHRISFVLGPTIIRDLPFEHLTYEGTVSELFGRVVMATKGRPVENGPLQSSRRERDQRRKRVRLLGSELTTDLLRARTTEEFVDHIIGRANALGRVPAHWSDAALQTAVTWPAACLGAWHGWKKGSESEGDEPCYVHPEEIVRMLEGTNCLNAAWVVRQVIDHALSAVPSEKRPARRTWLTEEYSRAQARLRQDGSHL